MTLVGFVLFSLGLLCSSAPDGSANDCTVYVDASSPNATAPYFNNLPQALLALPPSNHTQLLCFFPGVYSAEIGKVPSPLSFTALSSGVEIESLVLNEEFSSDLTLDGLHISSASLRSITHFSNCTLSQLTSTGGSITFNSCTLLHSNLTTRHSTITISHSTTQNYHISSTFLDLSTLRILHSTLHQTHIESYGTLLLHDTAVHWSEDLGIISYAQALINSSTFLCLPGVNPEEFPVWGPQIVVIASKRDCPFSCRDGWYSPGGVVDCIHCTGIPKNNTCELCPAGTEVNKLKEHCVGCPGTV